MAVNIHITIIEVNVFFFFSSRRRHTRCLSDWSSGVCSSDLFAVCQKLIEAGAHVVAADLAGERLEAAAGELDPGRRGLAAGVVMDVTDERSVAAGFAETCRLYGGVDILVLNAGIAHVSSIETTDPGAFRRVVD